MTETKYQITTVKRGTDESHNIDADSSWTIKVTLKGENLQLGEKERVQEEVKRGKLRSRHATIKNDVKTIRSVPQSLPHLPEAKM